VASETLVGVPLDAAFYAVSRYRHRTRMRQGGFERAEAAVFEDHCGDRTPPTRGGAIIDHAAVNVRDLDSAKSFYSKALAPLGISMAMEVEGFAGYASEKGFHFGIFRRDPVGGAHVAFACEDRAKVDAFYDAAMEAGGIDNGAPGFAATTTRTTTARSSTTRTATTSKPCARRRSSN
jgi:Glyoxalase/Bleomycin resistance protein/Dioxygenase superfamily